jgi:hypothetical protein
VLPRHRPASVGAELPAGRSRHRRAIHSRSWSVDVRGSCAVSRQEHRCPHEEPIRPWSSTSSPQRRDREPRPRDHRQSNILSGRLRQDKSAAFAGRVRPYSGPTTFIESRRSFARRALMFLQRAMRKEGAGDVKLYDVVKSSCKTLAPRGALSSAESYVSESLSRSAGSHPWDGLCRNDKEPPARLRIGTQKRRDSKRPRGRPVGKTERPASSVSRRGCKWNLVCSGAQKRAINQDGGKRGPRNRSFRGVLRSPAACRRVVEAGRPTNDGGAKTPRAPGACRREFQVGGFRREKDVGRSARPCTPPPRARSPPRRWRIERARSMRRPHQRRGEGG